MTKFNLRICGDSIPLSSYGFLATNLRRDSEFVIPAGMPESSHTDVKL